MKPKDIDPRPDIRAYAQPRDSKGRFKSWQGDGKALTVLYVFLLCEIAYFLYKAFT